MQEWCHQKTEKTHGWEVSIAHAPFSRSLNWNDSDACSISLQPQYRDRQMAALRSHKYKIECLPPLSYSSCLFPFLPRAGAKTHQASQLNYHIIAQKAKVIQITKKFIFWWFSEQSASTWARQEQEKGRIFSFQSPLSNKGDPGAA